MTGTAAGLIGELRARHPEAVAEAAARRRRRPFLDDSGRLMLIAADHPARAALGVRGRALAMADRRDLLAPPGRRAGPAGRRRGAGHG